MSTRSKVTSFARRWAGLATYFTTPASARAGGPLPTNREQALPACGRVRILRQRLDRAIGGVHRTSRLHYDRAVYRWLILAALVGGVAPLYAQEPTTRAEALRREREEKQKTVAPYESPGIERTLDFIEDRAIFLLTREGPYPKLGSLTTGSGFAAGLGIRNRALLKRHGTIDVWASGSMTGYFGLRGEITFPELADGRLFLRGYADHRDYPEEDYFGLGPASLRADQVNFAIRGETYGVRAAFQPVRSHVYIGGGLERIDRRLGRGLDPALPSIETKFDDTTAPGLSAQPDFLRTSAFIEADYRRPTYARNGGWYRLEYSHFADQTLDAYSFDRFDMDVRQAVSFLGERRVLWGRAAMSTSTVDEGQTMPFYEMPTLGGNSTLRGFRDYRFRAPHALLLQGEYRIEIWSALDFALFYDTGKVAERRADLDFSNLERDYGFGFRFNSDNGIFLRVDAAFGTRDGKHLWIVFGGVF